MEFIEKREEGTESAGNVEQKGSGAKGEKEGERAFAQFHG